MSVGVEYVSRDLNSRHLVVEHQPFQHVPKREVIRLRFRWLILGDVTVEDVDGEVVGNSVSGDVFISTSGIAEAATVSGSIEVHLGRVDWSGELSFGTVSGNVRVYMPEDLSAEVSFQSVTGNMESDFPITLRRRSGFRAGSLRGTIGNGGRDLDINTVSGNLRLLVEN